MKNNEVGNISIDSDVSSMNLNSISTADAVNNNNFLFNNNSQAQLTPLRVFKQTWIHSMIKKRCINTQEANVLVEKIKYSIPNTYREAIKILQAEQWKKAVIEELSSMNKEKFKH